MGAYAKRFPLMEEAPRATRLRLNVLEQPMNVSTVVSLSLDEIACSLSRETEKIDGLAGDDKAMFPESGTRNFI